jgi:hypothetical protein
VTLCRIGDTGPNGGRVFITPSTPGNASGLFFEAEVSSFSYNKAFGCGKKALPNTGAAIGDGLKNTAQIIHTCGWSSMVVEWSRRAALNDPNKAWFLPSSGELAEFHKNIAMLKGNNPFDFGNFWSSTVKGDKVVAATMDGSFFDRPRTAGWDFALVAAFKPDLSVAVIADAPRSYGVGDAGPGGGRVFITPTTPGNTTGMYFEVAPSNWSGTDLGDANVVNNKQVSWSCPAYHEVSLAGTQTAIGAGRANTKLINEKCASYTGPGLFAAREAANYRGGNRDDWFAPSKDEWRLILARIMDTAPGMMRPMANGGQALVQCTWTSSEAGPALGWGGNGSQLNDEVNSTNKSISTNCVLPVRMFLPNETMGPRG